MKLIWRFFIAVIKAWVTLLGLGLCMGLMKATYSLLMVIHHWIEEAFKGTCRRTSNHFKRYYQYYS